MDSQEKAANLREAANELLRDSRSFRPADRAEAEKDALNMVYQAMKYDREARKQGQG